MLFGKKKKEVPKKVDRNTEYYELLRKFDELIKKPGLTITELKKIGGSLLKPAMDHKPYSKSSEYNAACDEREQKYYRMYYRLSPSYRDNKYAKIISYFKNWYELMQKKENQNNPEKRKQTDSLLKKGYKYLCTELYRYGQDQKYQELNRVFYKLRNYYYNDLNGKQYYRVTLGYYEIPNYFDDMPPESHYCDEVTIQDQRVFYYSNNSLRRRIVNYDVPIYAVDDEQGLHDVITGKKVYHLTKPDADIRNYIWYTNLEPVDQGTVLLDLSFLGDEDFIRCNRDYKSRYQKEIDEAQEKCKVCFKRDYESAIEHQKELEKRVKAILNTGKILNKNL